MIVANPLLTEFNFTLPRGLVDDSGVLQQQGVMRLATARDELVAYKHRHVQAYPEYLMLVAQEVYCLVRQRLALERERAGNPYTRRSI